MRRVSLAVTFTLLAACSDTEEIPFVENLDISVCHQAAGPFSTTITNPFFPLVPGSQLVLDGIEDGVPARLQFTVLNQTQVIAGVTTLVIEERHTENSVLVEVSRNFFAQAPDGSVCYFGEDVDIYTNGAITSHDGQWRAGAGGASSGVFMPGTPAVGQAFRQEVAPGVAEDRVQITSMGDAVTVPFGSYTNTLTFLESTPLEPGVTSNKVFAHGVGLIVDDTGRLTARTP